VRGFLVGLILIAAIAVSLLSFRPGGWRQQLSNAGRRFKLAIVLVGIYLLGSAIVRGVAGDAGWLEWVPTGLAAVLVAVFAVLGQDRAPTLQAKPRPDHRQTEQR
jgi:hypothetical protein